MQSNNVARNDFKSFCATTGVERDGQRNVFVNKGKKFVWCSSPTGDIRQFYEDCQGAMINGRVFDKSQFKFGAVTRVTSKGVKAYQANLVS